jgi:hypothetical protein
MEGISRKTCPFPATDEANAVVRRVFELRVRRQDALARVGQDRQCFFGPGVHQDL